MQTVPCPVGYHIGSGYKPHQKWFKYELAKTHMYSWACCLLYARNVEIIVTALFLYLSVFLFTQFSLFYENLQLPLPISVKYWALTFKK